MAVLKDVPAASWKVVLAFLARSRMELAVPTWVRIERACAWYATKKALD